jgi:hypothetical protein
MKPLFFLSVLLVIVTWLYPQKKNQVATEIHFSQVWVWEYVNTYFEEGSPEYKGEMVVYFNPEKNYWLFTQEAFGLTDEMTVWTLGMPGGNYISSYTDEFGSQKEYTDNIDITKQNLLPKHYKPLENWKVFNSPEPGFLNFTAQEYRLDYSKTNEVTCLFLAETEIDFSPVYFFNLRNAEAKLPIHFPIDLPINIKVIEDETVMNQFSTTYKFKEQGHTTYTIEINSSK